MIIITIIIPKRIESPNNRIAVLWSPCCLLLREGGVVIPNITLQHSLRLPEAPKRPSTSSFSFITSDHSCVVVVPGTQQTRLTCMAPPHMNDDRGGGDGGGGGGG